MKAVGALLLFAAAVVVASRASGSFVPLFMWSGRPYFANDHTSVRSSVSLDQFRSMFSQILSTKQEVASDLLFMNTPVYYSQVHTKPEIVVAFVYSHLSSSAASRESGAYDASASTGVNANFQFLRTAVPSSVSSLSAPSYIAESAISEDITSLHAALEPSSEAFAAKIVGEDAAAIQSCDRLMNHLGDHAYMFNDKKSDLILVKYTGLSRNDRCMQRVVEHINERTNGDFLAIVSADSASATAVHTSFVESEAVVRGTNYVKKFNTLATATTSNSTSAYPGVTMITSSVFWGLIIALIMVIAITCGVCWVQSIETPARFASTPLVLSKEY